MFNQMANVSNISQTLDMITNNFSILVIKDRKKIFSKGL